MTKEELLKTLKHKPHLKVCSVQHRDNGVLENGLPKVDIIYELAPINYKFIELYSHINCVVLEDLDYETSNSST